jgi:hypothetical protein
MPEVQEQEGGAGLHAILCEDISQVLAGKNLGLDSHGQHVHAFPIPWFAIGFNEGKVPYHLRHLLDGQLREHKRSCLVRHGCLPKRVQPLGDPRLPRPEGSA